MDTMKNILYTSALETYDFAEKNKKHVVNLALMFMPKETKDFIFTNDFNNNEYYSELDLKLIEKDKRRKLTVSKKKRTIEPCDSLTKSMNKSKIKYASKFIPNKLLYFIIFCSYLSLHSIYFWTCFIIIIFVTNINYLMIGFFIVLINTVGIVFFSDCPIFILERKYRNKMKYNQDFFSNMLKNYYDNVMYHYSYEYLIEQLIFTLFLFLIKINCVILYRSFRCV
jgi:hypothetical protein